MPPADVAPGARRRLVVASVAVLLAAADTYVVVLLLPDMMTGVGITTDQLQRATPIITAFLLGYVAMLPLVGRLSDRYGRMPALLGCLAAFSFGSALTAAAQGLPLVVAGRGLQGLGGGGLVPVTLALVADSWPPERRGLPLGVVGAVQEGGSLLGPLYGAAVVAVSTWRTVFWLNLGLGVLLAVPVWRRPPTTNRARDRGDPVGRVLLLIGAVGLLLVLTAPAALTDNLVVGRLYTPLGNAGWLTPLLVGTVLVAALFVVWEVATPRGGRPVVPLRRLPQVVRSVDAPGSVLLAGALGCIVVAFASADPSRQVISVGGGWLLAAAALLAAGFAVREVRARDPLLPLNALRDPAAYGAMLVSLSLGAALMATLVDVPIFARTTRYPDSQLAAALVLVRFLAAVPVGALVGGAVCERLSYRLTTAAGMVLAAGSLAAMAGWRVDALAGPGSTVALVAGGLGFGIAIAPVNAAVLRAVAPRLHGLASSLVVVARMTGMLVGLSVLTAVGLRHFYAEAAKVGSPISLCPAAPTRCPAYDRALQHAALAELHTIFAGAAACALLAAVLAAVLLRPRPA